MIEVPVELQHDSNINRYKGCFRGTEGKGEEQEREDEGWTDMQRIVLLDRLELDSV